MNHLIFLFVDHFEPQKLDIVREWALRYPAMARNHRDADGFHPRHTWFVEGDRPELLEELRPLLRAGLGEIEFHLHHSHDTSDSLRELIGCRKRIFHAQGALITVSGQEAYGFIHGKWSLDNSRGAACCGVNDELRILRETGCYADFTFPAWGAMNPRKRNSIYYALDNPAFPKSYDTGVDVEVGREPSGDLMIFQGPGDRSGIPPWLGRFGMIRSIIQRRFLTCEVSRWNPPTPDRICRWVNAHVHVRGRPEWTFVKVHAHGGRSEDCSACLGPPTDDMFSYLEARYNDGRSWRLHYCTAREVYNIVKAAESGRTGDPGAYRDFVITPYQNCA